MLRILFTADDLASTRFLPEPAPMVELKFAAVGLRRGIRASWGERWPCGALAAVPVSARPVVRQFGGAGYAADPNLPAWPEDIYWDCGGSHDPYEPARTQVTHQQALAAARQYVTTGQRPPWCLGTPTTAWADEPLR